jgi:aspartate/methionine/tyrosine aminotransferase
MSILNASSNPNNPTGAVLTRHMLTKIIELAESKNIMIMSDEVYRPIFHSISPMSTDFPPSILSMGYANTIATGSLSKAYSLAGIRVGWIASRSPEIVEKIASARHYTTLSVSQLDSSVAAFALSPHAVHALIGRNIQLAKTNLEILEKFVIKHDDICEWVRPIAGTTAFLRFHRDGKAIDDVAFCRRLVQEAGVLWAPGSYSFGEEHKGYVRIGYVCETDVLKDGLGQVRIWLKKEFDDLEVVE